MKEELQALQHKRLAALLKSPELVKEYVNVIDESYWWGTSTAWIWDKVKTHYKEHGAIPSLPALRCYADMRSEQDPEKLVKAGAQQLLQDLETVAPMDPDYFRATLASEAREVKISNAIMGGIDTKNWIGIADAIKEAYRATTPLPKALDLQTLQTKISSDSQNLLNEWAFERQAILALVAPTGIGKSVMTMQLSTHFACGKATLGFEPKRPNRVLVIQNEDSDNDIALMRDGALSLLSDTEKATLYKNLFFVRLRGSSGKDFLSALDTYCTQYAPDIVFVNPLLKYYGGDPLNTRDVSDFLNELEPILERHNCGLIFVHHTIKQSKQSRLNQVDSSYSGFGSSAWSNSVRDTIEIRAAKVDGYYKLITGKRSNKWGWKECFIKRSENPSLPYWKIVDPSDLEALVKSEKSNTVSVQNRDAILNTLQPLPSTMTIEEIASKADVSEKTVRRYIKTLIEEKRVGTSPSPSGNGAKYYFRLGRNANN